MSLKYEPASEPLCISVKNVFSNWQGVSRLLGSYHRVEPAVQARLPQTLHLIPYNCTPYTLHPTPYTLHPTPYTLNPTPYTLNSKP